MRGRSSHGSVEAPHMAASSLNLELSETVAHKGKDMRKGESYE